MIRKLIDLCEKLKEAHEKHLQVAKDYGYSSLAELDSKVELEEAQSDLINFVLTNNINMYELADSYWKQAIQDTISCSCDFDDLRLSEHEERKIVDNVINDDNLQSKITETIEYYINKQCYVVL